MTTTKITYSIFKAIAKPFWLISNKLGFFAGLSILFASVLSGLSLLFSTVFHCSFTNEAETLCASFSTAYFFYLCTKTLIVILFIRSWIESLDNAKVNTAYLTQTLNGVFKTFLCLLIFVIFNTLPLISAYILFIRQPNPVWQIELLYFTVVGLGFLTPFLLMRFYAYLGEQLENKYHDSFWASWHNTQGFLFKILLSIGVLYIFVLALYISANSPTLAENGFIGSFIENIAFLLGIALTSNFMLIQRQIFLPQPNK